MSESTYSVFQAKSRVGLQENFQYSVTSLVAFGNGWVIGTLGALLFTQRNKEKNTPRLRFAEGAFQFTND